MAFFDHIIRSRVDTGGTAKGDVYGLGDGELVIEVMKQSRKINDVCYKTPKSLFEYNLLIMYICSVLHH